MYREGWLINPDRLRSSVIPSCVVAWNALAREGALPAVRFLVMHNCPVLERKMGTPPGTPAPITAPLPQATQPGTRVAGGDGTTDGSQSGDNYRPAKYRPPLSPQQMAHPSNWIEQYEVALSAFDADLVAIARARNKDATKS
jgi:hypothetical protein